MAMKIIAVLMSKDIILLNDFKEGIITYEKSVDQNTMNLAYEIAERIIFIINYILLIVTR